jgi:hypothetical protein
MVSEAMWRSQHSLQRLWTPLHPNVYRMSAAPTTIDTERRAALLWAGPRTLLSFRTAGRLWTYDGVEPEKKPEILVVGTRNPKSDRVIVHRTLDLPPRDKRIRNGMPVTWPTRTLVDLASVLSAEELECAVESARRMRLTTDREIGNALERIGGRGRRGAAQLASIVDEVVGQHPCESPLEVKVAGKLRLTQLPPPVRQYWIRVFGVRYRVDFAWPEIKIALECDSRRWHEFQKDRTRWRRLCASGWRILPVTKRDVTQDWAGVVDEIATALRPLVV